MQDKTNKEFKKIDKLYKHKPNWILLLQIIFAGIMALALGWFIGSIIVLKISCGG